MYWRYCDGLQEVDSCSSSVWSQLYASGWILPAEHTALVILVSVLCLPVLFLWCPPFNRVLYFPSVQVCINSKGMPAWFAVSSLLGYSVWLAFKGEWEGENWSARDHSDECARKEEGREPFETCLPSSRTLFSHRLTLRICFAKLLIWQVRWLSSWEFHL